MSTIPSSMQAVIAREPGDASVLTLVERPVPTPGPGQVLLQVHAAGINRPDIMQREGKATPPAGVTDILGLEACGVVAACGPGVAPCWLGQRLMALLPGGGYAQWAVADLDHCLPCPDGLGVEAAAALPEGLFTVWHNLFELGRLRMGETVLIHGGGGGIGTLAIRMAYAAGATVITTDGHAARAAALQALGAAQVIDYTSADFTAACLAFTQGHGVDVVLDIVGGDYVARNLQAMAFGGRHVSLSFMRGATVALDLLTLMQKQLSLHSSTMRPQTHAEKTRMARALHQHVLPLVADGRVGPTLHAALPLHEATKAHTLLESGAVFGKLVLQTQ